MIYDGKNKGVIPDKSGYYSGQQIWNLTPNTTIYGNFTPPVRDNSRKRDLKLEVRVKLIDSFEKETRNLQYNVGTYVWQSNSWFLEPRSFTRWK